MKVHRLSCAAQRICAAAIAAVSAVLMGFLLYILRGELLSMVLMGLAELLIAAALVFYLTSLFRAACRAEPEKKLLIVRGLTDDCLDLSRAVCVKTVPCAVGPISARTLVFSDESGGTVASVPTFFTVRQGAQAEPLAAALADELGLVFLPSLEPWEYDKEQRAAHEKELAKARAAARKETLRPLREKLFPEKSRKSPRAAAAAPPPDPDAAPAQEQGGINYDALDDER